MAKLDPPTSTKPTPLSPGVNQQNGTSARALHPRPDTMKPFTTAELEARTHAENYLRLAKSYGAANDILNAISCCLEGLIGTSGISRPLAVRDQLRDLLDILDPSGSLSRELKSCMTHDALEHHSSPREVTKRRSAPPKYLERLVSVHQLLSYPSEHRRFNRVYEDALACLRQNPSMVELYVVQYRTQLPGLRCGGELHFSFVPAALISRSGPYYLTDICAVLRP